MICFTGNGFAARMGNTGWRHDIAMNTLGDQVSLQGIAHVGCLVSDPDRTSWEMPGNLIKLNQQALQRGPAFKLHDFTGVFVEFRTVVLGIIDIKTNVDYSDFHRRLLITSATYVYE